MNARNVFRHLIAGVLHTMACISIKVDSKCSNKSSLRAVAQEIEGELHDLLFTFSKKEGTKPAVEVVMAHHFSKLQNPKRAGRKMNFNSLGANPLFCLHYSREQTKSSITSTSISGAISIKTMN
jgi:hypothetical protein